MKKNTVNNNVGAFLRQVREDKKLSLEEVAQVATLSTGYLSLLERGKREASHKTFAKLADGYQVELGELLKVGGYKSLDDELVPLSEDRALERLEAAWQFMKNDPMLAHIEGITNLNPPNWWKLSLVESYQDMSERVLLTNRELSLLKAIQRKEDVQHRRIPSLK